MGEIDPFWAKWGSDESSGACVFYVVIQRTFRQLRNGRFSPNLVTVSRRRIRQDIFENFHFRGHLPPKSEIESRSNRHLNQSRPRSRSRDALQRYILFTPRARHWQGVRSTFLYDVWLWRYGASKLSNCRILPIVGFWPIFPIGLQKP